MNAYLVGGQVRRAVDLAGALLRHPPFPRWTTSPPRIPGAHPGARGQIDAARAANDPVPAERAEAELDALVQQLSASFGLAGRSRQTGSVMERARSTVTWRIRAAVKRLGEVHPELGRHLQNAVRTGTWCAYRPRPTWCGAPRREPSASAIQRTVASTGWRV